jgi:hypothetical protein
MAVEAIDEESEGGSEGLEAMKIALRIVGVAKQPTATLLSVD